MLFLGIVGAQGICAGINPSFEMAHHLFISETKVVIIRSHMVETGLAATREYVLILNVPSRTKFESFHSRECC